VVVCAPWRRDSFSCCPQVSTNLNARIIHFCSSGAATLQSSAARRNTTISFATWRVVRTHYGRIMRELVGCPTSMGCAPAAFCARPSKGSRVLLQQDTPPTRLLAREMASHQQPNGKCGRAQASSFASSSYSPRVSLDSSAEVCRPPATVRDRLHCLSVDKVYGWQKIHSQKGEMRFPMIVTDNR